MTIILDTETTGLRAGEDELLQISIIDESGEVLIDQYLRPTVEEWPEAQAINHITPEDVRNCPHVWDPAVHDRIQRVLDDADLIIGYNTQFDIGFLIEAGFEIPIVMQIDVMREFAEIYGDFRPELGGYKWQRLTTAAEYYRYNWDIDAHNALGDCYATLYVYEHMKNDKRLRPCPFCGNTAGYAAGMIRCIHCGLDVTASYDHMNQETLMQAYNRRATDQTHGVPHTMTQDSRRAAAKTLAEIDKSLPDPDVPEGMTKIGDVLSDLLYTDTDSLPF